MHIANGVEMLELHVEGYGGRTTLNPTLIWDEETAILVDTGMPGQLANIRSAMKEAGVPFERLQAVVLTHQDFDHIGSIADILQANERIQVYAHPLEQPYIEGTLPLIKTNPEAMAATLAFLPEDERAKALAMFAHPPKAKVNKHLEAGQALPYCGGIQVIFTPGHTAGHISLYIQQTKTLIAGDAMICVNGRLRGPVQRTTLDMDTALRSLEKLTELDIEAVICYHGGLSNLHVNEQLEQLVEQSKQE